MISFAKSNSAASIVGIVLVFGLVYVMLSSSVLGGASLRESPFFVLNKGISLGALILLTCDFCLGPLSRLGIQMPEGWLNARKTMGMTGFLLVLMHALMSLMWLTPAVYGGLFDSNGAPTLVAGLSMLCGALALVMLCAYNLSFQTFLREDRAFNRLITSRKFMFWGLLLIAAHLLFVGFEDWIEPAGWHGGLPPAGLFAFTMISVGFVIYLLGGERKEEFNDD